MKAILLPTFFLLVATFFAQTAAAQGCGTCTGQLDITSVTYSGKSSGDDIVKVTYTFTGSSAGEHCLVATKIRFRVTVTRKNGHQDTGEQTFANSLSADVHVPRGVFETDPVSFKVDSSVTDFQVKVAPSTVKSSSGQTISQTADQQRVCCPKVDTVTIQSLGKEKNGVDDLVKVNWTTQLGNLDCLNVTGTKVSVRTIHVSGASCSSLPVIIPSVNGEANPLKAICNPEEIGDPSVRSIEATIAPQVKVGNCYITDGANGSF